MKSIPWVGEMLNISNFLCRLDNFWVLHRCYVYHVGFDLNRKRFHWLKGTGVCSWRAKWIMTTVTYRLDFRKSIPQQVIYINNNSLKLTSKAVWCIEMMIISYYVRETLTAWCVAMVNAELWLAHFSTPVPIIRTRIEYFLTVWLK